VKKTRTVPWRHVIRAAPNIRHSLVDLLLREQARIAGYYDAAVEQLLHESCRPPRLKIADIVQCQGGVVVVIASRDCRPNVLTDAIHNVLPKDTLAELPTWA
jgi:hypothetical protein